jgi:hypothetical protein
VFEAHIHSNHLHPTFFFGGKISLLGHPKKSIVTHAKDFCEKKGSKVARFQRKTFLKSPYLDNKFQQVAKI